jgi:hypothetical protein
MSLGLNYTGTNKGKILFFGQTRGLGFMPKIHPICQYVTTETKKQVWRVICL